MHELLLFLDQLNSLINHSFYTLSLPIHIGLFFSTKLFVICSTYCNT